MVISQIFIDIKGRHLPCGDGIDGRGWAGDAVAAGKNAGDALHHAGLIRQNPVSLRRNPRLRKGRGEAPLAHAENQDITGEPEGIFAGMLRRLHAEPVVLSHNLRLQPDRAHRIPVLMGLDMQKAHEGPEPDALLHGADDLLCKGRDIILFPGKYMHLGGAQADGGSRRIHGNIPSADEGHLLSLKVHGMPRCILLQEIRRRNDIFRIRIVHGNPVPQLGPQPQVNGVVILPQLGKGNILSHRTAGMNLDISGPENGPDIPVQPLLRQPILRNAVPEHTAQLLMLVEDHRLMAHQCQEIGRRKARGPAADNRYLLPGTHIGFRRLHHIRICMVRRIPLQSPDIQGMVDKRSPALSLAGMLADHGTGGWERISVPDPCNGTGIIPLFYKGNVSGHVHMGRTEGHAGNGLHHILRAAPLFDVASVFIRKLPEAVQDQVRGGDADRTVGRPGDHPAHGFHLLENLRGCISPQDVPEHPVHLHETVAAGHAFPAGLVHGNLQKRPVQGQRAHARRIGTHPGAEFAQYHIDPLIHTALFL